VGDSEPAITPAQPVSVESPTANIDCPDYDGDGWGFANGQSCRVGDSVSINPVTTTNETASVNTGAATAVIAASTDSDCPDYDGDGWGFANGQARAVELVIPYQRTR